MTLDGALPDEEMTADLPRSHTVKSKLDDA